KKRHMLAVQRVFLLDSLSLEHNVRLGSKFQPDFIEVLPGKLPEVMEEMKRQTNIPIIAGGLITKQEDIDAVFEAGAIGVSTSRKIYGKIKCVFKHVRGKITSMSIFIPIV